MEQSLVVAIEAELENVPQDWTSYCCIYKVPKLLRKMNEEAYTPVLVSIGPFHYQNERLLPMEAHKLKYLKTFLEESRMNANLNTYLQIIKEKETQIRRSYSEPVDITTDDFIRMVLIDSTFIIQVFRGEVSEKPFTFVELRHDLSLAENQLPFFILKDLYWAAFKPADNRQNTPYLTDIACEWLGVDKSKLEIDPIRTNEAVSLHLVDMLRSNRLQSPRVNETRVDVDRTMVCPTATSLYEATDSGVGSMVCPTATSLYGAGVKFYVAEQGSLLDVYFYTENGSLYIPKLLMDQSTEYLTRNLIAFEQCHSHYQPYIAHYSFLFDCLINTREDVQLLTNAGIIENLLGSENKVCTVVNSICTNVSFNRSLYAYKTITDKAIAYCNKDWNRRKAPIFKHFLHHPFAAVSVIYATVLLILTLSQTLTSILSVPGVLD